MDVTLNKSFKEKAHEAYEALMDFYYVKSDQLFLENYVKRADDRDFSYLWPFSGVLSAVNALAKIKGQEEQYQNDLTRVLNELEYYRDETAKPVAYDSYIRKQGGGSKFYDDNQWLGLDFIEAYRTLGDEQYLHLAKEMFDFSISGWDEKLDGGIYWQEDNKTSKNTCSNGPAAVLAMKLYEETGDDRYMAWAIKILDWTKGLFDPDCGVYGDNFTLDGSFDKTTYTYNTGTIIHTNALLYKETKDKVYLDEALKLADNSLAHFTKQQSDDQIAFFPASPWFNVILFKGYLALYEADPQKNLTYINRMRENVIYAWEHARDQNGLFSPDWSGKTKVNEKHKWLLDQAPMVEFYALLTQFE
ncbi:glycoside hydrolase family 76 protein [Bacillus niameyensis]|uniref:glycoside hydrolase family 76 protein n=1 Tax=Bacillus niameyensis TaxID=1522308 RepID=UPI00078214AB|nr:glycoside hydrolase family 76 protein [Bacillus niameyensis]